MLGAHRWLLAVSLLGAGLSLGYGGGADKKKDVLPETVSYAKDIRPIFQQHCLGCHQPAKADGGYVMTSHADLSRRAKRGAWHRCRQARGKHARQQITPHEGKKPEMPHGKEPLTDFEVNVITQWIAQGAKDDTPDDDRVVDDMEHPPVY